MPKVASRTTSMDQIKTLREKTNCGVMDAKKALEESKGDMKKAEDWIRARGMKLAEKKAGREAKQGVISSYVHQGNQVAVMVELNCETDFVAKTDEFVKLGREVAMQVASMKPANVEELLKQTYIRDPKMTIQELVKVVAGTMGENIVINRFVRLAVGETTEPKA